MPNDDPESAETTGSRRLAEGDDGPSDSGPDGHPPRISSTTADEEPDGDRRRALKLGALALVLAGAGGAYAGRDLLRPPSSDPTEPEPGPVAPGPPDVASRPLVDRYAPDLYFGRFERWYPTDPRPYRREVGDRTVVDGFDAVRAYSNEFRSTGRPPAPTVFYHVAPAAEGVISIQYWMYSVFDQFTVNFHWHDWELLQVFVDTETEEPVLLSASAHSRASPNNEFLHPDLEDGNRPIVLAEVGSHSSATDANGVIPSFERFPTETWRSDVTNDLTAITEQLTSPFAYGLPRDEGARLPFVMPELDDRPLYDHPDLPDVERTDFIDEGLTVGSWADLAGPPTDLPARQPGLVMTHPDSRTAGDVRYELVPIDEISEAIDAFTGPQLSFQFAIPAFAEDLYAEHITTVGIPWEQDRFSDPVADVTIPAHRRAIDGREPDGLGNRVIGALLLLGSGPNGAVRTLTAEEQEEIRDLIAVSLYPLPVEMAVRLASPSPESVVSNGGTFGFLHVDPGEHTLVANGPGLAPLGFRFDHPGGTVRAGTDGHLAVVANEDVAVIKGDGRETGGITTLAISEDFVGPIYEGRPMETDRFRVAVHRDGRYLVEITDREGREGAIRVVPGDRREIVLTELRGGKVSQIRALADGLSDTVELAVQLANQDDGGWEVVEQIGSAANDAERAAEIARSGGEREANDSLRRVRSWLADALDRLEADDRGGYREVSAAILTKRVRDADERTVRAIEAPI